MSARTSTSIALARDALVVLAVLAVALGAPTAAGAQEAPPIEVDVRIDPADATLGDLVTIHLVVDHPGDVIVTARPPAVAGTDLVGSPLPQTEAGGPHGERTTFEFVVQPFALGDLDVGALTIEWLREDSTSGRVGAEAPPLRVISVRAPGDTELRPLPPVLDVPGAPAAWVRPAATVAVVAVAVAAVALLAALAWRRWKPRPAATVLGLTAEERARAVLDTLTGRRLVTDVEFQHYYGTISATVRRYIEERFRFNATALTTTQLADRMVGAGLDRWQARLVAGLLVRCDAAVYARRYPDPSSADHDLTVAYEIVELSRPRAASEEREAVPA